MNTFEIPIDKQATCDATISEVLKSVALQNQSNNVLIGHKVQSTKVILTYQGYQAGVLVSRTAPDYQEQRA